MPYKRYAIRAIRNGETLWLTDDGQRCDESVDFTDWNERALVTYVTRGAAQRHIDRMRAWCEARKIRPRVVPVWERGGVFALMRAAVAALALLVTGCGGAIAGGVHDATQAAVATVDAPISKEELDDAARSLATSGTQAAIDVALAPATTQKLEATETALIRRLRDEARTTATVLLGDFVRALNAALDGLDPKVRAIVHGAFEQAIADAPALRESFAGAGLQADVAALGPIVTKAVNDSASAARAQADAEIARLRGLVIGLAAGVGVLLLAVAAIVVLHARLMRSHGQLVAALRRSP